jgi:hypothetical protein
MSGEHTSYGSIPILFFVDSARVVVSDILYRDKGGYLKLKSSQAITNPSRELCDDIVIARFTTKFATKQILHHTYCHHLQV